MKIVSSQNVESNVLGIPGAKDVRVKLLVGPTDGATKFVMVLLELAPGGNTPGHHHEWEEEIFVRSGSGMLKTADGENAVEDGTVIFFGSDESHQFVNTGSAPMELICVIPKR